MTNQSARLSLLAELHNHPRAGMAVVARRYVVPIAAVIAGCMFATPVVLFVGSVTMAVIAGWLATYSP